MSGSVPGVAGLAAVYLGCTSVAGICSMSLRQQVTPDHLLGRVTAAFWTIHFSLGPVGVALLTWAAGRFGVEAGVRGQRRSRAFSSARWPWPPRSGSEPRNPVPAGA